jgi:hypothetical protein
LLTISSGESSHRMLLAIAGKELKLYIPPPLAAELFHKSQLVMVVCTDCSIYIPPPPPEAELFQKMHPDIVGERDEPAKVYMPPPSGAVLLKKLQLYSDIWPCSLYIPPPAVPAEFSRKLQLVSVGEE